MRSPTVLSASALLLLLGSYAHAAPTHPLTPEGLFKEDPIAYTFPDPAEAKVWVPGSDTHACTATVDPTNDTLTLPLMNAAGTDVECRDELQRLRSGYLEIKDGNKALLMKLYLAPANLVTVVPDPVSDLSTVDLSGLSAGDTVYFWDSNSWIKGTYTGSGLDVDTKKVPKNGNVELEVRDKQNNAWVLTFNGGKGIKNRKYNQQCSNTSLRCAVPRSMREWCYSTDADSTLLCLDYAPGAQIPMRLDSGSTILSPNTPLSVRIQHAEGLTASVSATGQRGLTNLGWSNADLFSGIQGNSQDSDPEAINYIISPSQFAPRQPGPFDVTVELKNEDGDVVRQETIEMTVAQAYQGALRLGAAALWSPNRRSYESVTVPGSQTPEIQSAELSDTNNFAFDDNLDLELVVGFAVFFDKGGRVYDTPGKRRHLAPYFGLGVAGTDDTNLLALDTTFYAGMEYDLGGGASIAVTGAMPKVEELFDGFAVGGPSNGDTLPLRSGHSLGAAVVFNFSPEFAQVAKNPGIFSNN